LSREIPATYYFLTLFGWEKVGEFRLSKKEYLSQVINKNNRIQISDFKNLSLSP
jgi:hypothetical protein